MSRDDVAAGEFDPIPAQFWKPVRDLADRQPVVTWERLFERHVRVMVGTSREQQIQARQEDVSTHTFRVRRFSDTDMLDGTEGMTWRGKKWELTGVNFPNLAEIEIYCTMTNLQFEQDG